VCFPELFLKEFSADNKNVSEELKVVDEIEDEDVEFSVLAAKAGRGVAELLVDPVFHGWRRAMRMKGYMQGWRTKYSHNKHLIQDENCRIYKLCEHR